MAGAVYLLFSSPPALADLHRMKLGPHQAIPAWSWTWNCASQDSPDTFGELAIFLSDWLPLQETPAVNECRRQPKRLLKRVPCLHLVENFDDGQALLKLPTAWPGMRGERPPSSIPRPPGAIARPTFQTLRRVNTWRLVGMGRCEPKPRAAGGAIGPLPVKHSDTKRLHHEIRPICALERGCGACLRHFRPPGWRRAPNWADRWRCRPPFPCGHATP